MKKAIIFWSIGVVIIAYNLTIFFVGNRIKMKPVFKFYDDECIERLYSEADYYKAYTEDKKLIRNRINKEFDYSAYIYFGKNSRMLYNGAGGYAIIPLRIICVAEKMNYTNYIWCLTHEIVHIKYVCYNETWTNFMTFKLLYESSNFDFRQVAISFAIDYLNEWNYDNEEYNIGYYIHQYLEGKYASN